jgi:hypothetical protein
MLTCAIRRSGARGLDLFLTTGPDLDLSELGRRQVGQCRVHLGAGSAGAGPSGADGSGVDAAVTGPVLEDSSRVVDPGLG